ncbi:hypothetical protein HRI_003990100 [Hibiscus trionum]|uniref:Uncharacterized protein n=1 Tax=Hibiscus trionum TaxID=183268 RepID=A0A9W7J0I2_HIBTR|nr:hypothetical protein HRI_003990100 [Hibiscus trionum]
MLEPSLENHLNRVKNINHSPTIQAQTTLADQAPNGSGFVPEASPTQILASKHPNTIKITTNQFINQRSKSGTQTKHKTQDFKLKTTPKFSFPSSPKAQSKTIDSNTYNTPKSFQNNPYT